LTPAELWCLNPAEFREIYDAKNKTRREEWEFLDILNGVQCALLANINRSEQREPWGIDDFRVLKSQIERKEENMPVEQQEQYLKLITLALGGKVIKR
jgi:hypothetical protein